MSSALRPASAAKTAEPAVAILVPCYNEGKTIGAVVRDFKAALPRATVYVYDNNSSDDTMARAREAGAVVRREPLQGKGNVVRRMFSEIDADVYVMVDGDDTYDAGAAPELIASLLTAGHDMVVARRVTSDHAAYRFGHQFGNRLFTRGVQWLFGAGFTDILSGYRVMSRRFVKSFPSLAGGFEIEAALTVHALTLLIPVGEVATKYRNRPEGSASKLRTLVDGRKILASILTLLRRERPLAFFSVIAGLLLLTAAVLMVPIIETYFQIGLVPRFPTVIVATGLTVLASLAFACGLILDTVTQGRREARRIAYLAIPALSGWLGSDESSTTTGAINRKA
jgi:glycosyltransferase involved in cell wall biosynthesis